MASSRLKVAIFVHDEVIWSLPAWWETIPQLCQAGHQIVGIYLFPEVLKQLRGWRIPFYLLETFGLGRFFQLALYGVLRRLRSRYSGISSWESLAARNHIPLLRGDSPNEVSVHRWLADNLPDAVFIMLSNIITNKTLSAAPTTFINKHAALLPSCRGLYPYFWAVLKDEPLGVTVHKVDPRVDRGDILVQRKINDSYKAISMVSFYEHVFSLFPGMVLTALDVLARGQTVSRPDGINDSCYSLPTRQDYKAFKRKNGILIHLSDFLSLSRLDWK